MPRRVFVLAALTMVALVAFLDANDEVYIRNKEKPIKGPIAKESARGVELKTVKEPIAAEDIAEIVYDITPVTLLVGTYRPAVTAEKNYYDPDPKKEANRAAYLVEAQKKYAETLAKVQEKGAKRHIEYKIAALTARQAQDEGGDPDPALQKLIDFKSKHPNSWQLANCLRLLARLQMDQKQFKEAEATYLELAAADVSDDVKQEAELLAAQVALRAGKADVALKNLQKLMAKLPKDSKYQVRAKIAEAESLSATKKNPEAVKLLRKVLADTSDKAIKAAAYNALGACYLSTDQLKEARWEFLWVDVVYNQDKDEHARALYHLAQIFDKLGEAERAAECREQLAGDRAFLGNEYQRRAQREAPKGAP
ncbi:MAG: tetratricopeptide repeat protein [Gemmataceae bacterium]|nr:tetratricopeptide repeat protein [Gemmataceae bacterium]